MGGYSVYLSVISKIYTFGYMSVFYNYKMVIKITKFLNILKTKVKLLKM